MLTSGWYLHQRAKVKGRYPGAHSNLYKYATELAYRHLRAGGDAGLVLDGGLWSDLAANGLRRMLLDACTVSAVCGFTNNAGLFPDIHRSYKFTATVFRKGQETEEMPAIFMQHTFSDLGHFDSRAVSLPAQEIREDPRDSYPVPEIRSADHWRAQHALTSPPSLCDPRWDMEVYSRELNAGEQRHFFMLRKSKTSIPLIQGTNYNHFGVHQGDLPEFWVSLRDKGVGGFLRKKQEGRILTAIADYISDCGGSLKGSKRDSALAWIRQRTGKSKLPSNWVRLDLEGHRLSWRDVCRNDDKRTLICCLLPPNVAVTHVAPYIRPFKLTVCNEGVSYSERYSAPCLLYLTGCLSSFVCDSIARSRLSKNAPH